MNLIVIEYLKRLLKNKEISLNELENTVEQYKSNVSSAEQSLAFVENEIKALKEAIEKLNTKEETNGEITSENQTTQRKRKTTPTND